MSPFHVFAAISSEVIPSESRLLNVTHSLIDEYLFCYHVFHLLNSNLLMFLDSLVQIFRELPTDVLAEEKMLLAFVIEAKL